MIVCPVRSSLAILLAVGLLPVLDGRSSAYGQEDKVQQLRAAIDQANRGNHAEALGRFDKYIEAYPEEAAAYYWRGRSAFCETRVEQAVEDFDRYLELDAPAASRQWERGIALYYAKEFKKGAEQFELYQSYHDNDVENSTWRFACMARDVGIEKARETMLPIRDDRRVPMMEIYAMFRGESTAEKVLAKARADSPEKDDLNRQLFYAHLYIGLFHESEGRATQALEHVRLAREHRIDHYMWNVADVHVRLYDDSEDR